MVTTPFPQLSAFDVGFTSDCLFLGCAAIHVRLLFDTGVYPQGVPQVTVDIQGKEIYDPREDATVYSENAALALLDYMTDPKYGMGEAYPGDFDTDEITAAANICDEAVDLKAGGAEARYTANGVFQTSELPSDVIAALTTAFAGTAVFSSGVWAFFPGAWRGSSTIGLSEADARGPAKIQARASMRDIYNAVKGTYISPANNWQASDFPAWQNSTYLTEDGGSTPIWRDVQLPFTISPQTAMRIAKITLERARRQKVVTLQCKMSAYLCRPCDIVALSLSRLGFSGKTFEVTETDFVFVGTPPALGIDVTMQETDADIYDWDGSTEELAVLATGTVNMPDPTVVGNISDLTATLTMLSSGMSIPILTPVIDFSWTVAADIFVQSGGHAEFQAQRDGDSSWQPAGFASGVDTFLRSTVHLDSGKTYHTRGRAVNVNGVAAAWLSGPDIVIPAGLNNGIVFVDNPDFEASDQLFAGAPPGWTKRYTTGTIAYETSSPFSGSRSLKVTYSGSGDDEGVVSVREYTIKEGQSYRMVGEVKAESGAEAAIAFQFYDSGGSLLGQAIAEITGGGSFSALDSDWITVPSGAMMGRVLLVCIHGGTTSGKSVWFDEVRLLSQALPGVNVDVGNLSYRPLSNPLTAVDAGSHATINIADVFMRVVDYGDVEYSSGTITGLSYNETYYVMLTDPELEGGSVAYTAELVREDVLIPGDLYVGSIRTPAQGGPATIGNNDGGAGAQTGATYGTPFASCGSTNIVGNGTTSNETNAIDGNFLTAASLVVSGNGANNTCAITATNPTADNVGYSSIALGVTMQIVTNTLDVSDLPVVQVTVTQGAHSWTLRTAKIGATDTGQFQFSIRIPNLGADVACKVALNCGAALKANSGSLQVDVTEIAIQGSQ